MRKFLLLSLGMMMVLPGCTLTPDVQPPGDTMPGQYPEGPGYDTALTASDEQAETLNAVSWPNYYQDETLQQLITTGLENNKDLKTAALRISGARALYGIEKSGLVPDLSVDGGFRRQKTDASGAVEGAGGSSFIFQDYEVSLGFTAYEIDFFGRVRSLKDAALNDYLATKAAHRTVRTTLIADIAAAYVSLRANQSLLALAQETVQTRQESYDIIKRRAEEGVSTDLELAQAETLLLQARVDLYEFINSIEQDKNALRALLGTPDAMPVLDPEDKKYDIGPIMTDVPVGLPSTLLTSRPDIMEAEFRLYSANADIGAARAAFFPRISLTTAGGYSSGEFDNLFDTSSQIWTFAPQISLPVFTGGRLKNNLDLAEVRKDIAVVAYEKAIETAFREVADALSAASTFDDRLEAQENLVESAARRAELSERRYDAGVENYLAVLDAKRGLYTAQQNAILIRAGKLANLINLYKALGGGA